MVRGVLAMPHKYDNHTNWIKGATNGALSTDWMIPFTTGDGDKPSTRFEVRLRD